MAHRVGYRCSKPDCGIPTRGATSNEDGTINVGFAAHITAAAPGGPRYDQTLSSEQRKHQSNGLWLCGTHAKLVDSDENHFTVEELHKWKRLAERRAFLEVTSSKPLPTDIILSDDQDMQTVFDLLEDCSKAYLSAFQNTPLWPSHAVALNLHLVDGDSSKAFTVTELASGIDVYEQIVVIAPPGTGKTTTLLQLAEAMLANTTSVPVFITLSEWATGSDSFIQSVLKRAAFKNARESQFELLAQHGKLVLILDGWNELDEVSRKRVRNDMKAMRRDFLDIRLVISSRHKDFDIPIDGPVVEVELLTEELQLELAKSVRASDGESLMDHAWRTPGLRELVAIPLYLTALLKQAPGGSLPTTKEEVLRSFVAELEQDRDKQATLREALQGFHRTFLEEIAVEATQHETVALSEKQARAIVNVVQARLKDENQIEPIQPMKALDVLVSAHMLVRSDIEAGGVSFQHPQFQEWFASFHVQQLMLSAESGDTDAIKRLRESVLDIPVWEEAILFACDHLSRADQDGVKAVSHAILDTLGIDPLLSAEMIWRSSDEVWEQIRDNVMTFAGQWHKAGRVDRAVNFMIKTGRMEFSEYVWPLISNLDDQVHLHALRLGRRFRPGVLGPDAEKLISTLPDDVRKNVLSEIARNSGMDGIELATSLAKNDTNSKVIRSVIESLVFRRADRFAKQILQSAPDEVWRSLARSWSPHEFTDPEVSARIQHEADKLFIEETDPINILNTLLIKNVRDSDAGQKIRELVERIDFSDKGQDHRWVIHRAHELYPEEVVTALLSLLEQGKQVPYQADEMLRLSDVVIDEGPLVNYVLKYSGERRSAMTALSVVGSKIVGQLIDQLFALHTQIKGNNGTYDKSLSDEYQRLMDLISHAKANVFMEAVLVRANTEMPDEICILADLISQHGVNVERQPLRLDASTHDKVTAAVYLWAEILLASPDATRTQFAKIPQAAKRLKSPELVPVLLELLSEDLARRKRALDEVLDARRNGHQIQNDAHMCWSLQYRCAFASIGDEQTIDAMKTYLPHPEFGVDAALVLKEVWQKSQGEENESGLMKSWPNFSVVPDAHEKRQSGNTEETHPFVDDMVAAIDDLIMLGAEDVNFKHALKLSTVAFSMPYSDKGETIATLLQLPVPAVNKRDLLTILVLSGETISSEIVLRGIDELLEDAKEKLWMLQEQNGWRLKYWLRLLPFSERPAAILEVLDQVEGIQLEPWNLHELLSALGYAPSTEAETVLYELARRNERFQSEFDWLAALERRNTLSAARFLLGQICNMSFTKRSGRRDHTDLGKILSTFIVSHDQFRNDVYEKLPTIDDGPVKSVLEYAIAKTADTEGILLLTRDGAATDKPLRATVLYSALRHVLIGQMPVESSGMQQMYILSAPELRKGLFDMVVNGSAAESRLATECLGTIDEIHDNYGHVDTELRHPDIATGVPWPLVEWTEAYYSAILHTSSTVKPEELTTQNKMGMDLSKTADDIFKINIPILPGMVSVNINNAIKHLKNWRNKRKKRNPENE